MHNRPVFYPNPVTSTLYFSKGSGGEHFTGEIYDITGARMAGFVNERTVDTGDLPSGPYFLVLFGKDGNVSTYKLLKN